MSSETNVISNTGTLVVIRFARFVAEFDAHFSGAQGSSLSSLAIITGTTASAKEAPPWK